MPKLKEASFYGPKFVDWLALQGFQTSVHGNASPGFREQSLGVILGPALARRYTEWRRGGVAELKSVDKVCMKLGLDMNSIPDDVYKCKPE